MKKPKLLLIILLAVTSVNLIKCSKDNNLETGISKENNHGIISSKLDTLSFSHSMKGYELYSWPNENDWKFSILIGTNRLKTYNEVTTNRIVVIGKDSLKMILDKFPVNEHLVWRGKDWLRRCWHDNYGNLSLPDSITVNLIKKYCIQKELALVVVD